MQPRDNEKSDVSRNTLAILVIGAFIVLLGGAGVWYFLTTPRMDAVMRKTLDGISTITTYTHLVDTETALSDRIVRISGLYHINNTEKQYYSYSTTTLILPEGTTRTFSLHNVAIADDIFVKIETDDAVLQRSIPHSTQWRHFKNNAIPERFVGIATPGPILNNLSLFGSDGAYVSFVERVGATEWEGEPLIHYRFKLSGLALRGDDATIPAVAGHIGESGIIDVWVQEEQHVIRHMVFANPPYYSTTTIIGFDRATLPALPSETEIEQ